MFKKLKQNRFYEEIANQILEAMYRGDLKPGDKLSSENKLCEVFGVSRGTIREALRYLEQLGVIEVRQGAKGGSYVRKMDMDEVASQMEKALHITGITLDQISEVRFLLEEIIITRLIDCTDSEKYFDRMEETIRNAEKYLIAKDQKKRLAENIKFHTIIAEMTNNSLIILMHKITLNMLYGFIARVRPSLAHGQKTIQNHKKMVEYLKKGQYIQAAQVNTRHIKEAGELISLKSKEQTLFK
jgi:GntR family transcriptional regulator, transcriptional repressor for pyruvate dehydrogenase complex